ncbi:uncharacterized protein PAN0_014d4864 [Moesziomyces antarcticus]|uniref:Uncharacterized protein n=1 Tax=Pseudozyma antarctica TaxID=84753 RepID=A0A081CIZ5_PSEA2|nr:uncharacterized protein PAN0_014d4864 [Moesziomyces antarcticus]GAK66641.1 hypothetical protein PAN0_014d4864 [Moesziomyces antarcticus]
MASHFAPTPLFDARQQRRQIGVATHDAPTRSGRKAVMLNASFGTLCTQCNAPPIVWALMAAVHGFFVTMPEGADARSGSTAATACRALGIQFRSAVSCCPSQEIGLVTNANCIAWENRPKLMPSTHKDAPHHVFLGGQFHWQKHALVSAHRGRHWVSLDLQGVATVPAKRLDVRKKKKKKKLLRISVGGDTLLPSHARLSLASSPPNVTLHSPDPSARYASLTREKATATLSTVSGLAAAEVRVALGSSSHAEVLSSARRRPSYSETAQTAQTGEAPVEAQPLQRRSTWRAAPEPPHHTKAWRRQPTPRRCDERASMQPEPSDWTLQKKAHDGQQQQQHMSNQDRLAVQSRCSKGGNTGRQSWTMDGRASALGGLDNAGLQCQCHTALADYGVRARVEALSATLAILGCFRSVAVRTSFCHRISSKRAKARKGPLSDNSQREGNWSGGVDSVTSTVL